MNLPTAVRLFLKKLRAVPPTPKPARVRRDSTVLTDDILRRYAEDHKGGLKRAMARELLAARAVVNHARPLAQQSESLFQSRDKGLLVEESRFTDWGGSIGLTADAILEYDRVFAAPQPRQLEIQHENHQEA